MQVVARGGGDGASDGTTEEREVTVMGSGEMGILQKKKILQFYFFLLQYLAVFNLQKLFFII